MQDHTGDRRCRGDVGGRGGDVGGEAGAGLRPDLTPAPPPTPQRSGGAGNARTRCTASGCARSLSSLWS